MSEQEKYTPGPWGWEYSDPELTRPIALSSSPRDVLLASEDGDGPRAYISPSDARLIAAAPELLAALKRVSSIVADGDSICPYCRYRTECGHDLSCELNIAIRKAEGR